MRPGAFIGGIMSNCILLDGCINEFSEVNELSDYGKDEQFEFFCALQITKESDTCFSEIENSIVDGSQDGGFDSFIVLVNDRNIYSKEQIDDIKITENSEIKIALIQSKCSNSFTETVLDKFHISLPAFFDLTIDEDGLLERFNVSLVEKIEIFRELWRLSARKRATISIQVCYCCKAESVQTNSAFDLKMQQIVDLIKQKVVTAQVSFELFSSRELLDLYNKKKSQEIELKFIENPMPITFGEKYGYIGNVKLSEYVKFISDTNGKIIDSIFENNIRHYLGEVDVNKTIGKTIEEDKENDFWWFNNGITIISSDCRPFPRSLFLKDVQIINGLQTSFTIHSHKNTISSSDNRSVLIKIILVSDKKIVDKIIFSSNFQNSVPPVLLRATEPIQRDIETFCYSNNYYYDRRKGFYKNQGKPPNRIFTIQDMAQAIEAVLFQNPSSARKNPTTIIKSDKSYDKIFDNKIDFMAYLNCVLIVNSAKKYINTVIDAKNRSFARNFTFHFAMSIAANAVNKINYDANDIKLIVTSSFSNEFLSNCFAIVISNIQAYEEESDENYINIVKSKKFDIFLTKKLEESFAVKN